MKKNHFRFVGIAILVLILSFTAFSNSKTPADTDNMCYVHISTSYGADAKSVRVGTDVSGGISCVGGRTFYTDNKGDVTLKWSSGCYLKKIYVDGKGYDVNFKNGNSYSITMR